MIMKSTNFIIIMPLLLIGTTLAAQNQDWEDLKNYLGTWQSETKQDPQGKEYYFLYHLQYYDKNQTIIKMIITQTKSDGEEMILWEGFKGWDPVKKQVYYYGFSPSGRVGIGSGVSKDGYIWIYHGYSQDGKLVELRDEFTLVENGTFHSETHLKQNQNWKKISHEIWTKLD